MTGCTSSNQPNTGWICGICSWATMLNHPRDTYTFPLKYARGSCGLGAPPIRPEPKQQACVCFPLSMEPTTWVTVSRRPLRSQSPHTFVQPHVGGNPHHHFHLSRVAPQATSLTELTWQPTKQSRRIISNFQAKK